MSIHQVRIDFVDYILNQLREASEFLWFEVPEAIAQSAEDWEQCFGRKPVLVGNHIGLPSDYLLIEGHGEDPHWIYGHA